jgi:hypothetical protein
MASIGTVFVDFIARTGSLTSGANQAAGSVESAGMRMEGAATMALGLSRSLIALAGSVAGVMSIRELASVIEAADARMLKLGVTSQALGMSVTSLQAWDMAAAKVGVSTATIDTAMQRFEQRLGQAGANGVTKANADLKKLGVTIQQLQDMPQGEAFTILAQKISTLQNPAERARVTMELFGRSGLQLLPLFAQGAAGISQAKDQIEGMGAALSRMDVSKIAVANASLVEAKTAWEGVENSLALAVAPLLSGLADKFVDLVGKQDGFRSGFQRLTDNIVQGAAWIADAFRMIKAFALETWAGFELGGAIAYKSLQGLVFILNLVLQGLDGLANGAIYVWNALTKGVELFAVGASVAFDKLVYLALAGLSKLAQAVSSVFHVSLDGIQSSLTQWTHAVVEDSTTQQAKLKAIWEAPIKAGTISANLDGVQNAMGDMAQQSLDNAKKTMEQANALLATPPPSAGINQWWDNVKAKVNAASQAMTDLANKSVGVTSPQLQKAAIDFSKVWTKAGDGIAQNLADLMVTGKANFKELAASIIEDMIKMMIEAEIIKPIMAFLGGTSMGASLGFGGAMATGGPVSANTPYLVGEQGPEMFTPSSSGSIIPNTALGGMGGGGTQNNFHFAPSFANGVTKQDLASMMPNFMMQARQSVVDAIRRGGPYQQAVSGA